MNHYAQAPMVSMTERRPQPRERDDGSSALAITGGDKQQMRTGTLAKSLGWFSIGLGLAEVLAPRQLGRAIGVPANFAAFLPLLGMRELTSGLGILAQTTHSNAWIKSRVVGDMMDLAFLGAAFGAPESSRSKLAIATAAVVGVTALDVLCSTQQVKTQRMITRSIAIQRPASELYAFWRQLDRLPRVMRHLESVQTLDGGRSHWVAKPIAGRRYEWDAEITDDVPNQRLAWRSLHGSQVDHRGSVSFEQLSERRGTLVCVRLNYEPPAGNVGISIAKLLGQSPEQEIQKDLRRWKQLLETGEEATTEGQSTGRRSPLARILP
jgi:uncharacterized membrane protein